MRVCWQESATTRPTFNALKSKFNDILLNLGSQSYIDFNHIDPGKPCYDIAMDVVPDGCMDLPEFEIDLMDFSSQERRRSQSLSNPGTPTSNLNQRKTSLPHLLSKLFDNQRLPQTRSMERFKSRICSPTVMTEVDRTLSLVLPGNKEEQEKIRGGSSDRDTTGPVDRYTANPYEMFLRSFSVGMEGNAEPVPNRTTVTTKTEH